MNFRQAVEAVKKALKAPQGRSHDIDAREAINLARTTCAAKKAWKFMLREGVARNEGGYNDALVTVTQNSVTVALSSGTLPAGCAGWHFIPKAGNTERYAISSRTSDSEFVLDRPYEGDTTSGLACIIWDPYCIAPRDLHAWKSIRFEYGGYTLEYEDGEWFDKYWAAPRSLGNDVELVTIAEPTTDASQTSGTVILTAGSATVTLSASTWPVFCVGRQLRFQGETAMYKVKSRDSTTQVTLDRKYGGMFAGSHKTYELDPPGALRLEANGPMTDQYALKIRYFAEPRELVHDQDELEGPKSYQDAVVELARADFLMRNLPDSGSEMNNPAYMQMIQKAQASEKAGERLMDSLMGNAVAPTGHARMRNYKYMVQGRG